MDGLLPVIRQRAVHGGVVHHVRVAGVVGGHPEVADVGVLALDGDADLGQRQSAHVARNAAADGLIDVVAAQLLAHERQHEGRVLLDVDGVAAGEAEDEMLRQRVVERDGHVRPLRLAKVAVCAQLVPQRLDRVGYHAVDGGEVGAQRHAAVALNPFVYHRRGDEIGAEPAVFPECFDHAHRIAHHKPAHLDPCDEPAAERERRVLHAAPLAAGIDIRALYVALAYVMALFVALEEVLKSAVLLL